jgi:hypothetical protein
VVVRISVESSPEHSADRRIVILAIFLSTLAVAYFFAADHLFFSTRFLSKIFRHLLQKDDAKTVWLSLGVCLCAACWKRPEPVGIVADFLTAHIALVVLATVAVLALGTVFVYHNTAFSMDEYTEIFQARIFAAGQITAHLPPSVIDWLVPSGFNGGFIIASRSTGEAIGGYWPGFSLLLAPFEALGVPWLCNPCLSGIIVLLIHRITLEITGDRRAAGWAILFAISSGAFLAYGISYYSMQARLTLNLLFAWLLLKPTPGRCFAAGVTGSFALVVHSPLLPALFAAPWILAMIRDRNQRRRLLPLIGGYIPLAIVIGIGWLHLRAAISEGPSDFEPITSNIKGILKIPSTSMFNISVASIVKMWIWAVPGLFLIALTGRFRLGDDPRVRLLWQSAIATFVGYVFVVFDQGHGWGYRYFHSAWGVVPILAGCALAHRPPTSTRLSTFAGAAALLNFLLVVPYQLMQIDSIIVSHSAQLPDPSRPGRNVYFVRDIGFYAADLVQMDPLLRTSDLILFSRGRKLDAELRRQNWPDAVLIGRGPSIEQWNVGPASLQQMGEAATGHTPFAFAYADPAAASTPGR